MTIHAKHLTSWHSIRGLMGKKKPEPMFFQTRWGIHTCFMRFPIDVVILDEKQTIVKLKENLKPWRIFLWNPRYKNVTELPQGTITKEKLRIGETLYTR